MSSHQNKNNPIKENSTPTCPLCIGYLLIHPETSSHALQKDIWLKCITCGYCIKEQALRNIEYIKRHMDD